MAGPLFPANPPNFQTGLKIPEKHDPEFGNDPEKIVEDRQSKYGHPYENFNRTAALINAQFGTKFTGYDVGTIMIFVKQAREAHRPDQANRNDIKGYAICQDQWEERWKELGCPTP
jgi:Domain of unknown function (DUF6378)